MSELAWLPAAAAEYGNAVRWYDEQSPGLGAEFAEEFTARLARAQELPGAGRPEPSSPARFGLRWYSLSRFPYGLLLASFGGSQVVVAVAHEHRRPGYWAGRLAGLRL